MKFLILALLPLAASAAETREIRINGAAARELFDSLNLKAVPVVEEHTGLQYGIAKYGKTLGCERAMDSDSTYCWIRVQQ